MCRNDECMSMIHCMFSSQALWQHSYSFVMCFVQIGDPWSHDLCAGLDASYQASCTRRWMEELKDNFIGLDHLIALKLYTAFNDPQKELRKSYRTPFCENEDRVRAFARWRDLLEDAFMKSNVVLKEHAQPDILLYHGIDEIMPISRFSGIYYGPTSTTRSMSKARDFARDNGMILVLKPKPSKYRMLPIDWLSKYDETEFLIFDQEVEIQSVVLSSDYDQRKDYYHHVLGELENDDDLKRIFHHFVQGT